MWSMEAKSFFLVFPNGKGFPSNGLFWLRNFVAWEWSLTLRLKGMFCWLKVGHKREKKMCLFLIEKKKSQKIEKNSGLFA